MKSFDKAIEALHRLWCTLTEAVRIISANSGYDVPRGYINKIPGIKRWKIEGTNVALYWREDVLKHQVKQKAKQMPLFA